MKWSIELSIDLYGWLDDLLVGVVGLFRDWFDCALFCGRVGLSNIGRGGYEIYTKSVPGEDKPAETAGLFSYYQEFLHWLAGWLADWLIDEMVD